MTATQGLIVQVNGLPALPASAPAWMFPVPVGSTLMTAAIAYVDTLNLPLGTTILVLNTTTSTQYVLSGHWMEAGP